MGHFRRMHPQPHPAARLREQVPERTTADLYPGEHPPVVFVDDDFDSDYRPHHPIAFEQPADMPGAVPWQDRDREWYWRRALGVAR